MRALGGGGAPPSAERTPRIAAMRGRLVQSTDEIERLRYYKALTAILEPDDRMVADEDGSGVGGRFEVADGRSTCAICMDPYRPGERYKTCADCQNFLHSVCFKSWQEQQLASNGSVTCPSCRSVGSPGRRWKAWVSK